MEHNKLKSLNKFVNKIHLWKKFMNHEAEFKHCIEIDDLEEN